jgi:hypothetical protein
MPIRANIQQFSPPAPFLMHPLRKYYYSLLHLYRKYNGAQLMGVVSQITSNLGNLQEVLYRGYADNPDIKETINCIINLTSFYRHTGCTSTPLMHHIPAVLSRLGDRRLEVHFITEVLMSEWINPISSPELLIAQEISHCKHLDDLRLEGGSAIICTDVILRYFCNNR